LAPEPLLAMHNVTAGYGRVRIIDDFSMSVAEGESVAVLGPNGSGKSTLLRTISGIIVKRSGNIRFDGADITRLPSHRIVRLGVAQVSEGRNLFPGLTVAENLQMGSIILHTTGRRTEAEESLHLVCRLFPRLSERKAHLARTLSGGEQQMLAIGRALMSRPRLLLLDEPSVGLAPKVVSDLLQAMRALKELGLAVILAEQNVPLALGLADRAVVLQLGRVALTGDANSMKNNYEIRKIYLGPTKEVS
jgi:branched-chain amino acid transport system ATP-binding protein